ncbi:MAG: hypothetical protein NTX24_01465 [Candidatus Pacearchaeota archaeon]|nr:hypothetical protein [Candidatus Pacearchaeota archaeon]
MKHIEGYCFIARMKGAMGTSEFLFGKPIHNKRYENFQSNGLIPYETRGGALEGAKSFKAGPLEELFLCEIKLDIAGNLDEAEKELKKSSGLVVIATDKELPLENCIYGRIKEGKRADRPLPCASLAYTGFYNSSTFHNTKYKQTVVDKKMLVKSAYDNAFHVAGEVARQKLQGEGTVKIARFRIKREKKLIKTK